MSRTDGDTHLEGSGRAPSTVGVDDDLTGTTDSGHTERVDGRVLRGLRNRQALVDAYYDLAAETLELPRAIDVAARAGVSVRSLFQHFGDLNDLREAVVQDLCRRALERMLIEHNALDPSRPFEERLDFVLRERAELWELLRPLRHVNLLHDGTDPESLASGMIQQLRGAIREHLRHGFAPELSTIALDPELALSAFQATLSSATWDHLRFVHGYDIDTTVTVMRHMALAVLGLPTIE